MNIVCSDGIGGIAYAFSFADLLRKIRKQDSLHLHVVCSDSVFVLTQWLQTHARVFNSVTQWVDDNCKENSSCKNVFAGSDNDNDLCAFLDTVTYNLTPNRFCVGPFAPPLEKWGWTWQTIKENKFLLPLFSGVDNGKKVFLGLQTVQPNNTYPHLTEVVDDLCISLPDWQFHFIELEKWAGKTIVQPFDIDKVKNHPNFFLKKSGSIAIDFYYILRQFNYIIHTCNGVGNLAYFAGKTRFFIDVRYNNLDFYLRWRQSSADIIQGHLGPEEVSSIIKRGLREPHLNGLPKMKLL